MKSHIIEDAKTIEDLHKIEGFPGESLEMFAENFQSFAQSYIDHGRADGFVITINMRKDLYKAALQLGITTGTNQYIGPQCIF